MVQQCNTIPIKVLQLKLNTSTDVLAGDISEVKLFIVQDAYCQSVTYDIIKVISSYY